MMDYPPMLTVTAYNLLPGDLLYVEWLHRYDVVGEVNEYDGMVYVHDTAGNLPFIYNYNEPVRIRRRA